MAGRSSACGWPGGRLLAVGREVVCLRMAGRSSACGWPGGRLLPDGREVVCFQMAGRSSACGWPGGRLLADGREVVCVRTAENKRSSTDGPLSGRPRMARCGRPRMARGRLRMACPRFTVPDGRRGKFGLDQGLVRAGRVSAPLVGCATLVPR